MLRNDSISVRSIEDSFPKVAIGTADSASFRPRVTILLANSSSPVVPYRSSRIVHAGADGSGRDDGFTAALIGATESATGRRRMSVVTASTGNGRSGGPAEAPATP